MVMVFVVSPGAEGQRAGPGDVVVVARPGGAVDGAEWHRHRLVIGGRERDGEGEQRRLALPALLVQHVGDADARLVVQDGALAKATVDDYGSWAGGGLLGTQDPAGRCFKFPDFLHLPPRRTARTRRRRWSRRGCR